jgi:hypothetical protein
MGCVSLIQFLQALKYVTHDDDSRAGKLFAFKQTAQAIELAGGMSL